MGENEQTIVWFRYYLTFEKYIMTRTTGMKSGAKNDQILNYEFRI